MPDRWGAGLSSGLSINPLLPSTSLTIALAQDSIYLRSRFSWLISDLPPHDWMTCAARRTVFWFLTVLRLFGSQSFLLFLCFDGHSCLLRWIFPDRKRSFLWSDWLGESALGKVRSHVVWLSGYLLPFSMPIDLVMRRYDNLR